MCKNSFIKVFFVFIFFCSSPLAYASSKLGNFSIKSQGGWIKMSSKQADAQYEDVSGTELAIPTAVIPFGILIFGNKNNNLNHTAGYCVTLGINAIVTGLTKYAVERKRPNYDDAMANGGFSDKRSFFSGHSSQSFAVATYLSLYTYNHSENFLIKYCIPFLSEGGAAWVAWTRIHDHLHFTDDVIVGSAVGVTIASIIYYKYDKKAKKSIPLSLDIGQNHLGLAYSF
jgi:membrane-associated phospholipid phosphatase